MAGFTPNEGENVINDLLYNQVSTDRGINMELALFTNVAPDETITEATLTEPTGTGYARIALTDANWTGTNPKSYPQQTFTGGAGGWTGSVQGYAIITLGATKRILHIEVDPNGPYTITEGATYDITPNNTTD